MGLRGTKKLLDKTDSAIISELTSDARLPVSTIAARVNLSRNAVQQRIEKLERDGVIAGYTIKLGSDHTNREKAIAIVQIARRDRMRGAEVIHAIKCLNEVKSCYVMSGSNNDLFVEIEAENSVRINEICEEFWKLQGVKDTQTSFVLSVHKRGG